MQAYVFISVCFPAESRHILFAITASLISAVLYVQHDLADQEVGYMGTSTTYAGWSRCVLLLCAFYRSAVRYYLFAYMQLQCIIRCFEISYGIAASMLGW